MAVIERIDCRRYRLRFRRPFVTSAGIHTVREGYHVRVHDADGRVGYGEAAPLPGHGGEALADVLPALGALVRDLRDLVGEGGGEPGLDLDHPAGWRRLMDRLRRRHPGAPCACAGIDLALADLAARRMGLPLARWLSPRARDAVAVNAVIGAVAPDAAAAQARAAVAAGFTAIKVKIGAAVGDGEAGGTDRMGGAVDGGAVRDDSAASGDGGATTRSSGAGDGGDDGDAIAAADVLRVAAVRQAAGPGVAIRLDANGAWAPDRAVSMLRLFAPFAIAYIEQPVPGRDAGADVEALAYVRAASPIPIAADEILTVPGAVDRVLTVGAADVLVVKPALMGGLAAVWDLAARAAALPRPPAIVVTTALDSAVGRAGALHLAAALPGPDLPCGLATGGLLAEDVGPAEAVVRGRVAIGEAAGLGVGLGRAHPPG